ncbi:hypothetical protein VaNZ11_001089 [Volvox africanus]|uniref:Pyrroline-5-carboxylate reductase n=1 Tax=Volvox africanus TaxID=51714 RepID=A0ABQ5RPK7_9CHLO|nr:hypothetical protein VaNZ11_001089 [Volvox africanus]
MLQIYRVLGRHGFRDSFFPLAFRSSAALRGFSAAIFSPPVSSVKLTAEQVKGPVHLQSVIIVPQATAFPNAMTSATAVLDKRIGFLGSGQMAEALARGLIKRGLVTAERIACNDPNPVRKELFKSFGAMPYDSNVDVARNADVLFVAVKPQHVAQVLTEVRSVLTETHTVVSIAAGITVEKLVEAAGPDAHVVRVMPNTPCLVGETAAAMCLGGKATPEDEALVRTIFEAVGKIYTVDEKLLAAVTGLSGSGPAYVFMMVEALADGGVRAGLPRDIAQALAAQTVLGSAKMVLETGTHPGALKDMVTSPAGTTIAGVHELEKAGVRAAFMSAVVAATERANQLSKM